MKQTTTRGLDLLASSQVKLPLRKKEEELEMGSRPSLPQFPPSIGRWPIHFDSGIHYLLLLSSSICCPDSCAPISVTVAAQNPERKEGRKEGRKVG